MRGPQPWKTNRARTLRASNVSAEAKLWSRLRNRQLGGFKFIRQAPVGPYFADFLYREAKLIVEIDGATHSEPNEIAADQARQQALEKLGYRIVRVWNGDVTDNIEGVLEMLLAELRSPALTTPHTSPSPHRPRWGEGRGEGQPLARWRTHPPLRTR